MKTGRATCDTKSNLVCSLKDGIPDTNGNSPQNGFHKNTESFDVDPGDETFTEIHFQPPDERTLRHTETPNHVFCHKPPNGSTQFFPRVNSFLSHKLLPLIRGQAGQFVLPGRQLGLVVHEVSHHEPATRENDTEKVREIVRRHRDSHLEKNKRQNTTEKVCEIVKRHGGILIWRKKDFTHLFSRAFCLNSSIAFSNMVTETSAFSLSSKMSLLLLGTTTLHKFSYLLHQSPRYGLRTQKPNTSTVVSIVS